MNRNLVLAISGASGAVYALRLLEVLLESGHAVHLSISPAGQAVLRQELGLEIDLERFDPAALLPGVERIVPGSPLDRLRQPSSLARPRGFLWLAAAQYPALEYHHFRDLMAPIASGSFLTGGMVICPCSGGTASAVAHGTSSNLIHRAADVHLKERRPLVLVPRETPLSTIQLDNMRRCAEAGAVVLPAMPGWYHGVETLADLVDFVVARILDQLGIENRLIGRWGGG